MAGENQYKEFDTASIIPAGDSVVLLGRYKFRKRDLLLGGTAAVALLTCLILAIILGVVANRDGGHKLDNPVTSKLSQGVNCTATETTTTQRPSESDTKTTTMTLKPTETELRTSTTTTKSPETEPRSSTTTLAPTPPQCETVPCLKASMYALTSMDTSVDPCEDFYTFSCGKYADANPPTYFAQEENPITKIYDENKVKLMVLIWEPTTELHEHSYERKMKQFLRSCMNHFEKYNQKGQPFIDHIVAPLGGWYLLNNWNASQFDFQRTLTETNIRFMAHIFFSFNVLTKNHNWNEAIIEVNEGKTAIWHFSYDDEKLRQYVGNITSLLQSDFGFKTANADDIRQQVVEDVVEMHKIFDQMDHSFYDDDAHRPEKTKTLTELNSDMNNTFNFTHFLGVLFNDPGVTINSSTRVAVIRPTYFPKLGAVLQEYLQTDVGKRKLHNYIMFWLLEIYHVELSWDYVSVYDQVTGWSWAEDWAASTYQNCLYTIGNSMKEAVNALFVRKYVVTENKDEADDIMNHLVDEMVERVDSATWLSPADKVKAKRVVRDGIYKMGFNSLLQDTEYMESLYRTVNISLDNYFGNVLNLLQVERQEMIDLLKHPDDRSLWNINVYMPIIRYYTPWRELLATAAAMQSPLFDHQGPNYFNYGSIGSMLATELMNAINENSNGIELDGSGYGTWWSNDTKNNYNQLKGCAMDVQNTYSQLNNRSLSPYVNLTERNIRYATSLISRVAGLRLTYQAYKQKERETGQEAVPAGVHRYTADKMFFVARAQANCETVPRWVQVLQSFYGYYSSKDRINLEMSQVPEFAQAFGCRNGQRMKSEKTCSML